MKTIITFIIVFGILVLVHEFGHFFFAKRSGILVREFAIGMGPKIFYHQGKDGTAYTVRLLPLGGYVRMAGAGEEEAELHAGMVISLALENEEVVKINTSSKVQLPNAIPMEVSRYDLENELTITGFVNGNDEVEETYHVQHDATIIEQDGTEVRIAPLDVQFQSAKLWQRMLTNFAGPLNNFILGIVLFIIIAFMQGGALITNTNAIGKVQADSPAAAAGLKTGDQILTIDGKTIQTWDDITNQIRSKEGEAVTLEVAGQSAPVTLQPKMETVSGQKIARIGIEVPKDTSFFGKIKGGFMDAINSSLQIFKALGSLFTGFSLNKLGGPVMIFQLSSQAAAMGIVTILQLMAMLSMNLGIMNLLPIPVLDGGKLVLNIYEGVRGKPLSQEKEGILTLIGLAFMVILMVLVTWNDFRRFFF